MDLMEGMTLEVVEDSAEMVVIIAVVEEDMAKLLVVEMVKNMII